MAKKLDYNEETLNQEETTSYEDNGYENEKYENDIETFYVVKVLIPIDQYQTEYKALYLSSNNTLVPSIGNAKKYNSFEYAVDDSRSITDKYKQCKVWAPSYVMKKTKEINH